MSVITSPTTRRGASTAARVDAVSESYGSPDALGMALNDVSLGLGHGQFTAIMGPPVPALRPPFLGGTASVSLSGRPTC